MNYCDLTLSSPEENLACDEALLDLAEEQLEMKPGSGAFGGILRFWESTRYFVALGYGKEMAKEVNLEFCRQNTMPILRRCTGGGTVLQGPGVLNYALILNVDSNPSLQSITSTNHFVMESHRHVFSHLLRAPVEVGGHTDLAIGGLKFSGNAQRRRRKHILFHGAFLLHLDFALMEEALPIPAVQPAYRLGRPHGEFLMNLKMESRLIKEPIRNAWKALEPMHTIPYERIEMLVRQKYSSEGWNGRI